MINTAVQYTNDQLASNDSPLFSVLRRRSASSTFSGTSDSLWFRRWCILRLRTFSFLCNMVCPWPFLASIDSTTTQSTETGKTFAQVLADSGDTQLSQRPTKVVMVTRFELRYLRMSMSMELKIESGTFTLD